MFIISTIFFTPLLTAQAVRESIVQTVIEWKDEFASIFFKSEKEPAVINDVKIGYMVEGFESAEDTYHTNYVYKETFLCGYENIVITIYSKSSITSSNIDNDYADYYTISIADNNGIIISRENFSALVISDKKFIYYIDSSIDIGELINIYKNIEIF